MENIRYGSPDATDVQVCADALHEPARTYSPPSPPFPEGGRGGGVARRCTKTTPSCLLAPRCRDARRLSRQPPRPANRARTEQVYDAARLANADQFIRSFPDGGWAARNLCLMHMCVCVCAEGVVGLCGVRVCAFVLCVYVLALSYG